MDMNDLSAEGRGFLRSLAHHLEPLVLVGSGGLSDGVVAAVRVALRDHELIKVKLGQSFECDRKQAATKLATVVDAALVQLIGRVVVLYRRRTQDLPGRPRIEVPQ